MHAALAAEARLLVAAEGRRRVELVERIRPDDTGLHLRGDLEDLGALVGPDARREAVRDVVGLFDRLFRSAERHDGEYRTEDLLSRDPVGLRNAGEEGRRQPEASLRKGAGGLMNLGPFFDAAGDQLPDLLELYPGVDRSDVRVLVQGVAQTQCRDPILQFREDRLCDRLLHEKPRARAADVPLVEVDAVDDAFDGLVERRVLEDDVGRLASELECEALARPRRGALDELADLRRTGEGDL